MARPGLVVKIMSKLPKPGSKMGMGKSMPSESEDGEEMPEKEEGEPDEGKLAAAEELLAAFKSGDAKALVNAFDAYLDLNE